MHGHVQQARERSDCAAHAEGEGHDAHVLDRRIGEHALDVALAREEERRDHDRQQPEAHHQAAREAAPKRAVDQHLAAHHRVERHVQQQPRQHRRDRGRALGVGVGQPIVQGHEAHLGAVADQQEHERKREHRGLELVAHGVKLRPQQRAAARSEHPLGGEVEEDRAEQRLRYSHRAQDEVFPGRLEARGRAVQAHQQHRR
jgi:hypothetical protein